MTSAPNVSTPAGRQRRAFWLKHLHQWHWVSAALCLVGMLLFSVTGFTLNHAADIGAEAKVSRAKQVLPEPLRASLAAHVHDDDAPLPAELRDWLKSELSIRVGSAPAEWLDDEIYLSLPRPGGDAWLSINLGSGALEYERTDRGWVAWLNDLHKGRNAGPVWGWFIDLFAIVSVIFSITGLFLLKLHAGGRPATWPMLGFGLLLPVLIALLFIH